MLLGLGLSIQAAIDVFDQQYADDGVDHVRQNRLPMVLRINKYHSDRPAAQH